MESTTQAKGLQRFNYFLNLLQAILDKAASADNPTLSFYQQGARTPLFMLEALSRIYRKTLSEKPFKKMKDRFKALEDQLGAVDYYDAFSKELATHPAIAQQAKDYLAKRMNEELGKLKTLMQEDGWIGDDNKRMKKINEKLNEVDWQVSEKDNEDIKSFYRETINAIVASLDKGEINFDNVEEDVHELRREIRWLSIYPQALRGVMQLKTINPAPDYISKYLTPEIVNSSFNKMPEAKDEAHIIYLDANHFYAMSWLIAELGKLKDSGLKIEAVAETMLAAEAGLDKHIAEERATVLLGEGQMKMKDILEKSKSISNTFFAEKVLQQLLS